MKGLTFSLYWPLGRGLRSPRRLLVATQSDVRVLEHVCPPRYEFVPCLRHLWCILFLVYSKL